ncbi:MAG: hypothetical protein ABR526_08575 [Chthoniobacterales bacterium]
MPTRRILHPEDKLDALRKGNPFQPWDSLDDRRVCILCEKSFTGRQVDCSVTPMGRARLRCPTEGCAGTPRVWVRPGNPLISQEVWEDWARVLDAPKRLRLRGSSSKSKTQQRTAGAN